MGEKGREGRRERGDPSADHNLTTCIKIVGTAAGTSKLTPEEVVDEAACRARV